MSDSPQSASRAVGVDGADVDLRAATGHLVVKRGHRGRYRLTILHQGVRMSGDLTLDDVAHAGKALDAVALKRFARAAAALAGALVEARVRP